MRLIGLHMYGKDMSDTLIGGHITLLFTVEKDGRLLRNQGSRGAGFNVEHGVRATVLQIENQGAGEEIIFSAGSSLDEKIDLTEGKIEISIFDMHGKEMIDSTAIYIDLVEELRHAKLLENKDSYSIKVNLDLPTSQGFGMSAAGLVAVAYAFRELTGKGLAGQYLRLCHRIERIHGSGLGDVLGISAGGVEIRLQAGAPGASGRALGFGCPQQILLVWQPSEKRHTSKYIDDKEWQNKITLAGQKAVNNLKNKSWGHSQWNEILKQSRIFAQESDLLEEPERKHLLSTVREIVRELELQTKVSIRLCMLGVSLAILPRELSKPLKKEELKLISEQLDLLDIGFKLTNISG
jgi:pantoate kinase